MLDTLKVSVGRLARILVSQESCTASLDLVGVKFSCFKETYMSSISHPGECEFLGGRGTSNNMRYSGAREKLPPLPYHPSVSWRLGYRARFAGSCKLTPSNRSRLRKTPGDRAEDCASCQQGKLPPDLGFLSVSLQPLI